MKGNEYRLRGHFGLGGGWGGWDAIVICLEGIFLLGTGGGLLEGRDNCDCKVLVPGGGAGGATPGGNAGGGYFGGPPTGVTDPGSGLEEGGTVRAAGACSSAGLAVFTVEVR